MFVFCSPNTRTQFFTASKDYPYLFAKHDCAFISGLNFAQFLSRRLDKQSALSLGPAAGRQRQRNKLIQAYNIWGFLVCLAVGDLYQDRYVNVGPKGPMGPKGPKGPHEAHGPMGPRLRNGFGVREQTRNGHIYMYDCQGLYMYIIM